MPDSRRIELTADLRPASGGCLHNWTPLSGTELARPSQTPDVRELILGQFPFIAPYRLVHGEVQVLRILHQRTERVQDG